MTSSFQKGADKGPTVFRVLSQLLLQADPGAMELQSAPYDHDSDLARTISLLSPRDFGELWSLANSHHVVARTFPGLHKLMLGEAHERADWVQAAIHKEQSRIEHALSFLSPICDALQQVGDVVVIKSLDHWPDLGNDLDLYSNADSADIKAVMSGHFKAKKDERSWGDRLANKWNFIVPGLPELVEVHVSRLGQTGEQVDVTNSLIARSEVLQFGERGFRVPAPEDRLIISTLQRMYRHFYLRLCDVADTARLVDSGCVNFGYLKSLAGAAGIWRGLASYLVAVSGYVQDYRGEELPIPRVVKDAANFGNERVYFRRKFLRIPIFPHGVKLYASEWKKLFLNGKLQSTLRLSLLPGLAAAAALEMKLTGSDKGIW
jgi:hypothetical protein